MSGHVVPLSDPKPDRDRFIRTLMGEEPAAPPPLFEYLIDEVHRRSIITDLCGREWVEHAPGDRESQRRSYDNFIEVWHRLGYDFVRLEIGLPFPSHTLLGEDVTAAHHGRSWADEHRGAIESWADFERYPWPSVEKMDFSPLEYVSGHLPEGMGLITNHAAGPFEIATQIMSYEGFCLALYDQPELAAAVAGRVGALLESYSRQLIELPNVIALFQGDDMGFRSGTLVAPESLRTLFLPWHQRLARIAHEHGVPYFLHSCGDVSAVMEDFISTVGIDGKHSFEDAILPAPDFHSRYGDRIATLGGVDMDILAGSTPERVRARTLELMSACAPRGRFAIGSGNSIPSYVPLENYLAMVNAALTWQSD